jgi:excisionase family DNA binding protein
VIDDLRGELVIQQPRFDLARCVRPFVTATELARYLTCDPRTIRRMIANGSLPGVRAGRCWRIPTDAARRAFHVQPVFHGEQSQAS